MTSTPRASAAHSGRRLARRAGLGAVALSAAAAAALAVVPSAAAGETLRLSTADPQNTDLDLGEPGPSAGDTQVFVDEVRRGGRPVGSLTGACTLTSLTETRLIASCSATLLFTDGASLTAQGAFEENPQVGPTGYRWAITGGTGKYRGAGGELSATFGPEDSTELVIRLG